MKFIEQYWWEHQKLLSVDSAGIPKYDKLENQAYCINRIKKEKFCNKYESEPRERIFTMIEL